MAKLSAAQIRKIIKAHNIEATVKIPTGLKKDELEKFVESKGFKINHDEKSISKGGKKITLEQAEKITAPKQKTALQKQKAAEKKEEKAIAQKKKERELKKEAVKKATKDLVPKTSMPKKVGSKPVPKKKEEPKPVPKKEAPKKKETPKPVPKKEVKKPKRKQLGKTQKPGESAVVQPGKPEDLKLRTTVKKKVTKKVKVVKLLKPAEYKKLKSKPVKDLLPREKEQIKKYEEILEKEKPKAAPKAEPKKEKPAWLIKAEKERAEREQKQKVDMLKQYKDSWEKNFKKQYQWTDAQVKRIEEILFDKNGIKSTGAENVEDPSGFKLFFSVDGKTESSATFKFPKLTQKKKDQSMMKGAKKADNLTKEVLLNAVINHIGVIEQVTDPDSELKKQLKTLLTLEKNMKKGKYSGFTDPQKKVIENALINYIDSFEGEEDVKNLVEKAKELQKKFSSKPGKN